MIHFISFQKKIEIDFSKDKIDINIIKLNKYQLNKSE